MGNTGHEGFSYETGKIMLLTALISVFSIYSKGNTFRNYGTTTPSVQSGCGPDRKGGSFGASCLKRKSGAAAPLRTMETDSTPCGLPQQLAP
ncbi:hypothetical protein AGIG_G11360 [Arapaima gigas]